MNCGEATRLLSDRFCQVLTPDVEARLDEHLTGCDLCRETADATASLWSRFEDVEIDVPHDRLRARFHAALAAYEERAHQSRIDGLLFRLAPQRPAVQFALAAALLVVGILVGRSLPSPHPEGESQIPNEIGAVSLALLEHPSASERLRGVAWAKRAELSDQVAAALIATVRNDPSVNVRLAAVEALSAGLDRPRIGEGLTNALNVQESPMMQVALAEVLLDGGVDGSTVALHQLVQQQGLDPIVREYLETVLEQARDDSGNDSFF